MEDDNFWDDGVDDSAYDALLELEQDAYRTTQQGAVVPPSIETQQQQLQQLQELQQHDQPASRPVRPSLIRHSTSNTSSSTVEQRRRRRNPTQHLRPALSFGDTDYQQWDASVLDKDDGLDLVDEQDALLETPGESGEGGGQQLGYTSTSLAPGQWRRITADEPGVMVEPMQTDGLQGSHADTSFHTHPLAAAHVEELKDQIEQVWAFIYTYRLLKIQEANCIHVKKNKADSRARKACSRTSSSNGFRGSTSWRDCHYSG